jgi:hypothetical protein
MSTLIVLIFILVLTFTSLFFYRFGLGCLPILVLLMIYLLQLLIEVFIEHFIAVFLTKLFISSFSVRHGCSLVHHLTQKC